MRGESGMSVNKQSSWASAGSVWTTGTADEQGVYSWKLDEVDKAAILADEAAMENDSVQEADVSLSNYPLQEDEMMSWLRYPLDDSFEKTYCSDFFGDLPNANVQLLRDSFPYQSGKEHGNASGTSGSTILGNISHAAGLLGSSGKEEHGLRSTVANADAAMALGASRAAGLIPPASAEAETFYKVRTSMQPSTCKSANLSKVKTPGFPPKQIIASSEHPLATDLPSLQNLKAADTFQASESPSQRAKPGSTKIANRCSHAAAPHNPKLHVMGARQEYGNLGRREAASTPGDSSAESTTTALSGIGSSKEPDLKSLARRSNQFSVARRWQLSTSPLFRQDADLVAGRKLEQDDCLNSSYSASVVTATDKASEALGIPELTITSASLGSGSSLDRSGKETASSSKRKMISQGDESECQSEDAEDTAPNSKMPVEGRPCTTKRNRAAEIHNLSERRRRNRINEKMKALQRLIPNANKTDKASMLDEAIEYLKLLQSQIQLMSMRTGVGIPQMMIPMGLQHLQLQQMLPLPHTGVGMGVGVGLGMRMGVGMMDAGVPAPGHPIVPFQSLPGQMPPGPSHYATGVQPSTSPFKSHETHQNQQHPVMVESHDTYLAHQQRQPMQMDVNTHTNMNMYNALMEQQQTQQQQQHQSQQAEGNCSSKRVW